MAFDFSQVHIDGLTKYSRTVTGREDTLATEIFFDAAALLGPDGKTGTGRASILEVWYDIQGYDGVQIVFDHATDVVALELSEGQGYFDFRDVGGISDTTGDTPVYNVLIVTPAVTVPTDSYTIRMNLRKLPRS
jgi:hypothetical protein